MIVEYRTYLLKPGSAPEWERRFSEFKHLRTSVSPLGGLWHVTTGPLNTLVHFWPYESLEHRMDVRFRVSRLPNWPPPMRDLLVDMESAVYQPASFSPPFTEAHHGSLYEFCIDSFLPGGTGECEEAWKTAIEDRARYSPLVFCGASEFGPLNRWLHVWAYRNPAHREEVMSLLKQQECWPPRTGLGKLVKQESFFAEPADFSPLH